MSWLGIHRDLVMPPGHVSAQNVEYQDTVNTLCQECHGVHAFGLDVKVCWVKGFGQLSCRHCRRVIDKWKV